MNEAPVAGVDVSKEFSDMCILAPDNTVFERVKVYHDKTSMGRAVKALDRAKPCLGEYFNSILANYYLKKCETKLPKVACCAVSRNSLTLSSLSLEIKSPL